MAVSEDPNEYDGVDGEDSSGLVVVEVTLG